MMLGKAQPLALHSVTFEPQQMGSLSHLSQSHQSQPLGLRPRSPLAAAERAKRAELIDNDSQ